MVTHKITVCDPMKVLVDLVNYILCCPQESDMGDIVSYSSLSAFSNLPFHILLLKESLDVFLLT